MRASEVRRHVLRDHEEIRGILVSLEGLARDVIEGESELAEPLRTEGEVLLSRLRVHMRWEDAHLRPALAQADDRGRSRAEQLDREHREQRELLKHELRCVQDGSRPPLLVARNLLDFAELLRKEMDEEEQAMLDPGVLRD